ncbi:hypothetical protein [Burkholderia mayonis]|uniref:hypothetical protein n=1 Tax=Burkholderia mayonis TaxID=1385591 RepID=UPI001CF79019|nr:hypothetical protein [Burkholderia mayonis]
MSVDLAAVNLPIVASSFAAQHIPQGVGQLSGSHGGTRASGSPVQYRGHDAVQKVSDLIHTSARRRAAAARKRPPGKVKKFCRDFPGFKTPRRERCQATPAETPYDSKCFNSVTRPPLFVIFHAEFAFFAWPWRYRAPPRFASTRFFF